MPSPHQSVEQRNVIYFIDDITEVVAQKYANGSYTLIFNVPHLPVKQLVYVKSRTLEVRQFKSLNAVASEVALLGFDKLTVKL